ncbi:MAG: hypothetical protein Q7S86_03585 [bacterium]|nr:hypothetical protein [bacterium]
MSTPNISPYIWNAKMGSEVSAVSGMFCWNLRLPIPQNAGGVVVGIEKQQNNPNPALTIEWTLGGEKVTLKHPDPYGLIGLVIKN